jgi:alpha-D-ribose 1-methylphosphonate 5-triphosphate synthase subunit PhnG
MDPLSGSTEIIVFERPTVTELAKKISHADILGVLARVQSEELKAEAEAVLPLLGNIEVIQNRSGLVMLPMRDTVTGTDFHLGEVLVAEAHVRLTDRAAEGYGMIIGRDLEQAMAMAVIDAAFDAGIAVGRITSFVTQAGNAQKMTDNETLRRVEATRVEMETF